MLANVYGAFQTLHYDHQLWNNELKFYIDEVRIFESYLEEFVVKAKPEHRDLMADFEHFQNQFIRQKEVLDELRHDIRLREQKLSKDIQQGVRMTDKDKIEYQEMKDRMITFRKIYRELKLEFYMFMTKWIKSPKL